MESDYFEITTTHVLFVVTGVALLIAGYALVSSSQILPTAQTSPNVQMPPKMSRMSLTSFDKELAKQFMDKDGDGTCDACGMPVEMCISSGQMQCNMDPQSTIGVLGSQHIHADFKVYLDGNAVDFNKKDYFMKSSFMHVDPSPNSDEASGTLHMHASGVPLWIFFESVGIQLNKDCLALDTGEKFCTNDKKKLNFFVNGKPDSGYENYVFNDLDKILVSYGDETDLTAQLNALTDFAKNH